MNTPDLALRRRSIRALTTTELRLAHGGKGSGTGTGTGTSGPCGTSTQKTK
ncbi:MAG: hypothetical protein ACRDUB_13210 [Mycobacterium sp.]